jgi:hypothetical protein
LQSLPHQPLVQPAWAAPCIPGAVRSAERSCEATEFADAPAQLELPISPRELEAAEQTVSPMKLEARLAPRELSPLANGDAPELASLPVGQPRPVAGSLVTWEL